MLQAPLKELVFCSLMLAPFHDIVLLSLICFCLSSSRSFHYTGAGDLLTAFLVSFGGVAQHLRVLGPEASVSGLEGIGASDQAAEKRPRKRCLQLYK